MSETGKNGLLDLEKELTCSICTEILYQPLTLLDCLHTFCGSCLKLWFSWQATSNPSQRSNPYTCPSCRASVRGTRPDAKITTLLDMYLQVNPGKGKTKEEKDDMASKYKPGDNVIPRVRSQAEEINDDDRRMVEEARAMSLRDNESRGQRSYERGTRHRQRSRGADEGSSRSIAAARDLEHQSSLRSLISSSEVDSREMEEEILRQIAEEGLLDGIDLQNLDERQQDELSERIAEAYRRRHAQRRPQDTRRPPRETSRQRQAAAAPTPTSAQQPGTRRHGRSSSTNDQQANSSRPPISRPHLFESHPTSQASSSHRRRTSSETRRQTSPVPPGFNNVRQEAARSATDLSQRPRPAEHRGRRPSESQSHNRSSTDPRPRRMSENTRPQIVSSPTSGSSVELRRRDSPRGTGSPMLSPTLNNHTSSPHSQSPPATGGPRDPAPDSFRRTAAVASAQEAQRSRPSSSSSTTNRSRPTLYQEPSVSCDSCGRADMQYDLHYNCEICHNGKWNICYRCYRIGKGCLHFFGFGHAAWPRFQQRASAGQDLPHALVGRQYQRPPVASLSVNPAGGNITMTSDDPAKRLVSGAFCSICKSYASDCLWACSVCNDGEWGYCQTCVNTGFLCTHPLLPLAHISSQKDKTPTPNPNPPHSESSFASLISPSMMQSFPPSNRRESGLFRPLTWSVTCSICSYPIPPNQSRFHCYACDSGDHDVCNSCYSRLCDTGRISRDNGDKGWRRCLRGHRMIVYYFDDSPVGQRRVVVRDLVGGRFLKDKLDANGNITTSAPEEVGTGKYSWIGSDGERQSKTVLSRIGAGASDHSTSVGNTKRFPPDGGVGMKVRALYTWLPAEGVSDELSFPRNAEIGEAWEISNEWFQGSYAGMKGLFPSNYGEVLHMVGY